MKIDLAPSFFTICLYLYIYSYTHTYIGREMKMMGMMMKKRWGIFFRVYDEEDGDEKDMTND